ncbi:MAG: hypothetical protein DLM61_17530 [Pseudonocardiales bacterium]|nr:MAG: hypothetical protein DLM61_17530 [Pseudonocardiales bacterium]
MTTASRSVRLATVLRWPLGLALVSWQYMWRTTPLHRSEEQGSIADLPEHWDTDDDPDGRRQGLAAGVGPLLHRVYTVRIGHSTMSPATLMEAVAASLNRVSPEMAVFRKTCGADGPLRHGDEYLVRMPGPWDGPVRVVGRDATSFQLATLRGHLEAGQIKFRAAQDGDELRFEIESWARAGDRLSHLLYNRLRLAKEIQLNMWTHFCVRTAALAGGRPRGGVTIHTRRLDWPPTVASPASADVDRHDPIRQDASSFDFVFTPAIRPVLRLVGVSPVTAGVDLTPTHVLIRFGWWRISLQRSNIRTATVTGPFRPWKALGPRLSLADKGLTLGTNSDRAVCLTLRQPIAGLLPGWLLRHPNLTLTVARPDELAALLTPSIAAPELDAGGVARP